MQVGGGGNNSLRRPSVGTVNWKTAITAGLAQKKSSTMASPSVVQGNVTLLLPPLTPQAYSGDLVTPPTHFTALGSPSPSFDHEQMRSPLTINVLIPTGSTPRTARVGFCVSPGIPEGEVE